MCGLAVLTWLALNWAILERFGVYGDQLAQLAERVEQIMTGTTDASVLTTEVPCPRTGYPVVVNTPRGTVEGVPRSKAEWIADHNETVALVEADCAQ